MLYYKNRKNKLLTENDLRQICEDSGGSFCGEIYHKWLWERLKKGILKKITVDEARKIQRKKV